MSDKEFQKKIRFSLLVQVGLSRSTLLWGRIMIAMIEADFIPASEIPDDSYEMGQMAIDFVFWKVGQSDRPDWYKREWVREDW